MNKVQSTAIPNNSLVLDGMGHYHFFDAYQVVTPKNGNIEELLKQIFRMPPWAKALMNLRNVIIKPFGLKSDKEMGGNAKNEDGAKSTFFNVIAKNENEIIMAENDKHLYFRLSVHKKPQASLNLVTVTTIVKFNNLFGRVYFAVIKPFHKVIVKSLLKKL